MKSRSLLVFLLSFLLITASAQKPARVSSCVPDLGTGDGKDGAGNALTSFIAGNYTLDGNGNFVSTGKVVVVISSAGNNVLNFNNFTLNPNDSFVVNEIGYEGPLIIKCTGTATINGTIDLAGKTAKDFCTSPRSGPGGAGGPCGGQLGGAGGTGLNNGISGYSYANMGGGGTFGKSSGSTGIFGYGSGGGGGNYGGGATAGAKGDNSSGGDAGLAYGTADFSVNIAYGAYNGPLCGGSGGGGGGGGYTGINAYGSGGGGGGGAVEILADSIIIGTQSTAINVSGGNGGNPGGYGPCSGQPPVGGGGGGGAGGSLVLGYATSYINNFGSDANLKYSGGTGGGANSYKGGNGGSGRFLVAQICSFSVGLKEDKISDAIKVFPNPVTDFVNFIFPYAQHNSLLKIYDLAGRELRSIVFSGKKLTLNREGISSGIYICKSISHNQITGSGKIIIF